jgi:tetratricopeptide (TPR) repeat protein
VTPPLQADSSAVRTGLHAVVGDALARTGRLNDALGLLSRTLPARSPQAERAGHVAHTRAWSPFGMQGLALIGLGRLSEVEQLLAAAHEDLPLNSGSLESAIVAANLAALRLEQGRVQSSFLQATSAASIFMDLGLPVSARWCYAHCALSLALAGVDAKATETLAALDALGLPTDMEYEVDVLRARAWSWAATGDLETARKNLEVAVDLATEVGDFLGATRALHDLARLGRARQVLDQLSELAAQVDGELTQARLAYTRAAATKEGHALDSAARRFEEIGTLLYAAEALGEAAVQFRRQGQNREAAAAQQKAARLLSRCEGAVTPFVRAIGARAQ